MHFSRLLLGFVLLAASCSLLVIGEDAPRFQIVKTLHLNNGLAWGNWGDVEHCSEGSFAAFLEAKFEDYSFLDTDETALNALKLFCTNLTTHVPTGYITSTEGEKGEWKGVKACNMGYMTAVRARVLKYEGIIGDDVAVQNFQMDCDGHEIVTAVEGEYRSPKIPLGTWGEWAVCPENSAICGIQTRYNAVSLTADDAAIADAAFFCCAYNPT